MPYFLGLLALLGVAAFWLTRPRLATYTGIELVDPRPDLLTAARRWNFRRRYDVHPVDVVEEPELAAASLAIAIDAVSGVPAPAQRAALQASLQRQFGLPNRDAEELMVLGQWLANQCGAPLQAVPRLAQRLQRLGGSGAFAPVQAAMHDIAAAIDGLTAEQRDALTEADRIIQHR